MHNEYLYGVILYLLCPSSWYDVYIRNACLYKALYALMPFLPQVYLMYKKFDRFPKKIKYCFSLSMMQHSIYMVYNCAIQLNAYACFKNWFFKFKNFKLYMNCNLNEFFVLFFSVHILIWLKRKGPGFYLVNSFSS